MTAKKYLFVVTAIALVLAVSTVAFDRIVDPFWYYRDVTLEGFNAVKPKFKNYERHVKPAIVQRMQPASLIFGSSFSEIGFDPLHPALRSVGKSYNFALAGALWDMVFCDVQFAISHDDALRQVVLGIHPETMAKKDCRNEIVSMENPEKRAFLFSYDALEASINTVLQQHSKPSHTADGLYFYTRGLRGTESRFREVFNIHPPCNIKNVSAIGMAPKNANMEQLDLSGLSDILRKTAEKGIEIKLVVYPRHILSFEQEYQCGIRQFRWNALMQIVKLAHQEAGDLAQVWDFEGYHKIGTEPISDAAGQYWQDPGHFNYEFGNIMLDEMFGLKPAKFGMKLTSTNLSARADSEQKDRAAFLQAHPELLQQLENLLPHQTN
ncbi:hypothetical protein GALL_181410 [mine drainage metagenome]|uniref:Uncharacterized protein n=1 Tax=mine drainage metagenome TaxID=410659 RepID=A0A1J5RTZ1_9ZZZZ